MKAVLIGATGFVGSHILQEALRRGHEITAVVRRPERVPVLAGVTATGLDVRDGADLAHLLYGHEAVISAFSVERNTPDAYQSRVEGDKSIVAATKKAGTRRLLAVGGAGSLERYPGRQLVEEPDFPEDWKPIALATRQLLYALREEPDLDWTFLCPAQIIRPGERTGVFRLGGDQLLMDADGQSLISLQDYAMAMIDELEVPGHSRQRFSVAY
jgi:putative NADH-flavin reductase